MKKLNVGAGYMWFEDGWETLDNSPLRSIKKKAFNIMESVGIVNLKIFLMTFYSQAIC